MKNQFAYYLEKKPPPNIAYVPPLTCLMKGAGSCLGVVMGVRSGRLGGSLGVCTPVGGSPGLAELTGVIATLIFLGTGADTDLLRMETLELLRIDRYKS